MEQPKKLAKATETVKAPLGRKPLKGQKKRSFNVYLIQPDKDLLMAKHGSLTAILEREIKKLQRGKV